MPLTDELQWYAIRTYSRCEKTVRAELISRQVNCLLPVGYRVSHWKDRTKKIEWPLFPGYCFARFGAAHRYTVGTTPGVADIVGGAHGPEAIPEAEMAVLDRIIELSGRCRPWPYLKEGRTVLVVRGPLQGLRGILLRQADETRLVVSVHVIQQATAVRIDADDVTPLDHFSNVA